jgi:hypothetical protein
VSDEITTAKLSDLTPDGNNANRGTERGAALLESSLRKYGAGRSVLLDRKGRIIAGNKTVETAGAIGLEDVIIVKTDGKRLVAVQREDLDLADDDSGAREMAFADNRVGEADLSWDPEQILADINAGVDLGGLWSDDELDSILADVRSPDFQPVGADEQPRLDEKNPVICPHCGKNIHDDEA